jgi:hypothetical protein
LLTSKDPILQLINQGFKLKIGIDLVKNLKKVVFAVLEGEYHEWADNIKLMAPFILFQTNATFNCTFEDFNELKNLPMCKEMMMMKSIPQVLNWDDNTNA